MTTTVVTTEETNPSPSEISNDPVGDTAVQIAQIQAETQIELANIDAAVTLERIEQQSDSNGELQLARERISFLEGQLTTLQDQINTLQNPPQLLAETTEQVAEVLETLPETSSTLVSTLTPESETPTEHLPESVDAVVVEQVPEAQPTSGRVRTVMIV